MLHIWNEDSNVIWRMGSSGLPSNVGHPLQENILIHLYPGYFLSGLSPLAAGSLAPECVFMVFIHCLAPTVSRNT